MADDSLGRRMPTQADIQSMERELRPALNAFITDYVGIGTEGGYTNFEAWRAYWDFSGNHALQCCFFNQILNDWVITNAETGTTGVTGGSHGDSDTVVTVVTEGEANSTGLKALFPDSFLKLFFAYYLIQAVHEKIIGSAVHATQQGGSFVSFWPLLQKTWQTATECLPDEPFHNKLMTDTNREQAQFSLLLCARENTPDRDTLEKMRGANEALNTSGIFAAMVVVFLRALTTKVTSSDSLLEDELSVSERHVPAPAPAHSLAFHIGGGSAILDKDAVEDPVSDSWEDTSVIAPVTSTSNANTGSSKAPYPVVATVMALTASKTSTKPTTSPEKRKETREDRLHQLSKEGWLRQYESSKKYTKDFSDACNGLIGPVKAQRGQHAGIRQKLLNEAWEKEAAARVEWNKLRPSKEVDMELFA